MLALVNKHASCSKKDGCLIITFFQSPIPHPVFCGHNSIDTQNPFSYTPVTKKEVLIIKYLVAVLREVACRR